MKQGRDLVTLAQEIKRRSDAKQDYLADTRELVIAGDGKDLLAPMLAKPFVITDYTHGQIAEHTGIPKAYYDRLRNEQPTLFKTNVETWLRSKPARRMIRTLDGRARAFLSDQYRRIDNEDVFESAMNSLMSVPNMQLVSHDVTDSRLYIKALFPKIAPGPAKVGDIQAGVVIANGELGNGSLSVSLMTYRLWCLNGATHEKVMRQSHTGKRVESGVDGIVYRSETIEADDKALLMKLQDMIVSVQGVPFDKEIARQHELAGAPPAENPIKAVEVLAKKVGLTETRKDSILTKLLEQRDYSPFGIVQAVTAHAATEASYDDASELEALGGKMTAWAANDWNEILKAA